MRPLFELAFTIVFVVVLLTVPTVVLGWILYVSDAVERVPFWGWVVLAPALYFVWFVLYLLFSAGVANLAFRRFPKPEFAQKPTQLDFSSPKLRSESLESILLGMSYLLLSVIQSLPLGDLLLKVRLTMRSYAPSHHIADDVSVMGTVYDPEITWIGERTLVGHETVLVAHAYKVLSQEEYQFRSAPIRIGRNVTIGGRSYIGMGVTIGDGAVVRLASYVEPFTTIGPGEVWGGNPARLLNSEGSTERGTNDSNLSVGFSVDQDRIRRLVIDALHIIDDRGQGPLDAESFAEWDSLGRCAIGAEIYGRYGIRLTPDQIMHLNSIDDVIRAVQGSDVDHDNAELNSLEIPDDPEFLPLLGFNAARAATGELLSRSVDIVASQKLVIAANYTATSLEEGVRRWTRCFGIDTQVEFAGYDQVIQSLLSPDGAFTRQADALPVVLLCLEHLQEPAGTRVIDKVSPVLDAIAKFGQQNPGRRIIVGTLPQVVLRTVHLDPSEANAARSEWRRRLDNMPHVDLVDIAGALERLGTERAGSSAFEATARTPYSLDGFDAMSAVLARAVRARHLAPAKVIALDCDGVLWGGVVGEDGKDGVRLGPDGEGRAHMLFQEVVLGLQQQGVLIALVSRNEERDVWSMFEHSSMILKREMISASRINWNSKSDNLRELAAELNLGLDAFVFVDDDPANRIEVATALPQAHVVPLPTEAELFGDTLASLWLFDQSDITAEDRNRTAMMQQERLRDESRDSASSYEQYLSELALRISVRPPDDGEWGRVAQLAQRTNQFNLSLKRRGLEEFQALGDDYEVLVLEASDRFGDYGLTGLLVLQATVSDKDLLHVDTFLLSCRVLGRGVEQGLLQVAAERALATGRSRIRAEFTLGPRNTPVLEFFRKAGFNEGEGFFEAEVNGLQGKPAYLELTIHSSS